MNEVLYYFLFSLQIFLPLVAIAILFYLGGMIWTFRQTLPYVPTPKRVIAEMIRVAAIQSKDRVIDLGSGTGGITEAIARRYPNNELTGIEKLWIPFFISRLRRAIFFPGRKKYFFFHGDMLTVSLKDKTVIMGFWIPKMITELVPKFERECTPGTRVISYFFPVPFNSEGKTRNGFSPSDTSPFQGASKRGMNPRLSADDHPAPRAQGINKLKGDWAEKKFPVPVQRKKEFIFVYTKIA